MSALDDVVCQAISEANRCALRTPIELAAPEMYEALRVLRTRGTEHEGEDCWCPSARHVATRGHTNECAMARAALAKADGK